MCAGFGGRISRHPNGTATSPVIRKQVRTKCHAYQHSYAHQASVSCAQAPVGRPREGVLCLASKQNVPPTTAASGAAPSAAAMNDPECPPLHLQHPAEVSALALELPVRLHSGILSDVAGAAAPPTFECIPTVREGRSGIAVPLA